MRDFCFLQQDWFKNSSRKIKRLLFFLGVTTLLTGCNDLNSQFTCPKQPGVSCQSLDQVNTLIDQGKLADDSLPKKKSTKINAQPTVIRVNQIFTENNIALPYKLRTTDNVMRLWIAPYIDTQGNYFSATVVYHVVDRGQWMGESIDDIRGLKSSDSLTKFSEKDHV
jgi:conjugal transfer pilus assembly protein TraV